MSDGYVKYHRSALSPVSSLRQVSRADRATFMDYVALARWQAPYAGCLCEADGTPWSRERRAREVGETYATTKRTEERLEAAGLITFQSRGVEHHAAVGRLHITNFATYQHTTEDPPKAKGAEVSDPSKVEGPPFKSEGKTLQNRRENPSELKGAVAGTPPCRNEGSTGGTTIEPWPPVDTVSGASPSESEGSAGEEVKKVKKGTEEEGPASASLSLNDQCCEQLAPFFEGCRDGAVATVESAMACHPRAKEFILAACSALRIRYEAGNKNVHPSYLPGNLLDLIKRDETRTSGSGAPASAEPWDPDLGYLKGEERRIRKLQLERQRRMNEEEADRERSRTVPAE